jgi:hypothetical protein
MCLRGLPLPCRAEREDVMQVSRRAAPRQGIFVSEVLTRNVLASALLKQESCHAGITHSGV